MITAVRLRLLPAREAQIALVAFFATRAEGCAAMLERAGRGHRGGGDGLRRRRGAGARGRRLPGRGAGRRRLRAADRGRRHARAGARAGATMLEDCSAGDALAIEQPAERGGAVALARRLQRRAVGRARGEGVSEDVSFPVERLQEGLERFEQLADAPRAELVRVRARRRRQRARDGAGRPRRRGRARRARRPSARSCSRWSASSAARSPPSTASGWLKRGLLAAQWDTRTVAAARADQARVRPEGPAEPGQEAARMPGAAITPAS